MELTLNLTPVGKVVKVSGVLLRVATTSTGCGGCHFDEDQGAQMCQYSAFCFACNRPDNKSVKFIKVEQ